MLTPHEKSEGLRSLTPMAPRAPDPDPGLVLPGIPRALRAGDRLSNAAVGQASGVRAASALRAGALRGGTGINGVAGARCGLGQRPVRGSMARLRERADA